MLLCIYEVQILVLHTLLDSELAELFNTIPMEKIILYWVHGKSLYQPHFRHVRPFQDSDGMNATVLDFILNFPEEPQPTNQPCLTAFIDN